MKIMIERITLFLFVMVVMCPGNAYSLDGWETSLSVSVSKAENRLSFGQKTNATDDIDGWYDVPAMLSGDVMVYFLNQEGNYYWRDIKGMSGDEAKVWSIRIESPLKGELVVLKWNLHTLPEGRNLCLIDRTNGIIIDMKVDNQYSYINNRVNELKIEVY